VRRRYNYRCRAPPSCRDIKTHPFPPEASLPSLPPITLSLLAHRSLSLSLSLSPPPLSISFPAFSSPFSFPLSPDLALNSATGASDQTRYDTRRSLRATFAIESATSFPRLPVGRSIDRDRRSDLRAIGVNILSSTKFMRQRTAWLSREAGSERRFPLEMRSRGLAAPSAAPVPVRRHAPRHTVSRHVAPRFPDAAHVFR